MLAPLARYDGVEDVEATVIHDHQVMREVLPLQRRLSSASYVDDFGTIWQEAAELHIAQPALGDATLKGYSFPDLTTDAHFAGLAGWRDGNWDRFRIVQLGMLFWERTWAMRSMENIDQCDRGTGTLTRRLLIDNRRVLVYDAREDGDMTTRAKKTSQVNLAIIAASILLGFLLTVQFRSTAAYLPQREQSRLASVDAVGRLEDEQRDLKQRIAGLRTQVAALQRNANSMPSSAAVAADLDQQRVLAGLVAMRGPGLIVTLDDSTKMIGQADDANNYIIHDYELRDAVSLLWLAGAEAIAVNGERIVNVSSLYCVGSTILVNDTRLSPPYEVRGIGDPAVLEQAVQNPRNLAKLRARAKTYGIQFKVAPQKEIIVPAFGGNLHIRYARPGTPPDRNEPRKQQGMQ